jgi:hypothetical protein
MIRLTEVIRELDGAASFNTLTMREYYLWKLTELKQSSGQLIS